VSGFAESPAEKLDGVVASLSCLWFFEQDSLGNNHHFIYKLYSQFWALVDVVGDDCECVEHVQEILVVELAVERSHVRNALVKQFNEVERVNLLCNYLLLYLVCLHQLLLPRQVMRAASWLRFWKALLAEVVQRRDGLIEFLGSSGEPRSHQLCD